MSEISADDNNLILLDQYGDPLPDQRGTRMIEAESYERVVEGLKMAAEGAAHLAVHEYRSRNIAACNIHSGLARRLDQVRRIAVEIGGVDIAMKQQETAEVRGQPLRYREARQRLRDGLRQASGGMRQLATCHRGDLRWSTMADALEAMLNKINTQHGLSVARQPTPFIDRSTGIH